MTTEKLRMKGKGGTAIIRIKGKDAPELIKDIEAAFNALDMEKVEPKQEQSRA